MIEVAMLRFAVSVLAAAMFASAASADPEPAGAARIQSESIEPGQFGRAVATLDFDGDGMDEIAVSDTRELQGGVPARGIVRLYKRTAQGYQSFNLVDIQSADVQFGEVLATGDFDEDGRDDLLIGAPGLGSGGGGVYLWRHTDALTTILQGVVLNGGPSGGRCGSAFAVGDFNDDGNLDFAAGCPTATFDGNTSVGRVIRAYGNGAGLFNLGFISQATPNVGGEPEEGDRFGAALAGGDFDCNGFDDLAIGVPSETVDGGLTTGAMHVLFGSGAGLSGDGSQLWHQGVADVPGSSGAGDHFATSLAAGNLDGSILSACDDLAIGIPDDAENPGGSILILDGAAGTGLTATSSQLLTIADFLPDQGAFPPRPSPEARNRMAATLVAADAGRGSRVDLLIGVEGYSAFLMADSPGMACVAFSSVATGVLGGGQRCYGGRDLPAAQSDRRFGLALATGSVDEEAGIDLVVGAANSNQAFVLQGQLFSNSFEGNAD